MYCRNGTFFIFSISLNLTKYDEILRKIRLFLYTTLL